MPDSLYPALEQTGFDFVLAADQWIQPMMVMDRDYRFVFANRSYLRFVNRSWEDLEGRNFFDVFDMSEARHAEVKDRFDGALGGKVTVLAHQLPHGESPRDDPRILHWIQKPFRNIEGRITHIVQRCEDVTDRAELLRQNQIMTSELAHRIKNMFSVIMATARISGTVAYDLDSFIDEFNDRLVAMSRVYSQLTTNDWRGLDLRGLLEEELDYFTRRRNNTYSLSGPDITLSLKSTKDAALLIHEMASNASKYGCFSQPAGHLSVSWALEGDHLVVHWEETGLTGIEPPKRKGFGTILFQMLPNVKVKRDYRDTGLVTTLWVPVPVALTDPAPSS